MNLIELGSLGEFIGSVAVLITLIYLAIQMKQTKHGLEANTTAILGASEVNGNESTMRHLTALYTDESMIDLIMRATQNLDDLPPSDYFKFHVFCHAGFQLHQITTEFRSPLSPCQQAESPVFGALAHHKNLKGKFQKSSRSASSV